MKYIVKITTLLFIILLIACEDDQFGEVSAPDVSISYSPQNPKVGDTVTFTISGDADFLTLFTGDSLHEYDYSRVRYEMDYGISSFEDTVYRRRTSPDNAVYRKYFKDYNNVDKVLEDFNFWGAIDPASVELGEFDLPDGSVVEGSHPKQLKFTITDRRIPSGLSFFPNIHLFNRLMYIEMRLVPDEEDRLVRFGEGRNAKGVTSGWRFHFYDLEDETTYIAGVNPEDFTDYNDSFIPGYENLPGADPDFEPRGFINDWEFNCSESNDPMLPPKGTLNGAKREFNDIANRHMHRIHPLVDNQLDASDYSPYSYKNHPERALISQADIMIGGSTYNIYQDPGSTLSGYDPETGFPMDEIDYGSFKGFQGDVYLTSIEWGWHTYLPYDEGYSVGSDFGKNTKTFKYVYNEAGEYNVSLIGTNVGGKVYTGSGYNDGRNYSANEYNFKRSLVEVDIKVGN